MSAPVTVMLLARRIDCHNGVASYLETLTSGLREAGDRVILVSGEVTVPEGTGARRDAIADAVISWVILDRLQPMRPTLKHLRELVALVRDNDVDVISPQGFSMLPIAAFVGRLLGRKIVANYLPSLQGQKASSMVGGIQISNRLAYIALTFLFGADRYIAMSREIAEFFKERCLIPADRIKELVLGVDTNFYRRPTQDERRSARSRFRLSDSSLVVVLPGRINLNKGHDIAAAAIRMLRVKRPELSIACLFPGGNDQRNQIEVDVLRDLDDRATFQFLGFVDEETLRNSYWAADIVLLPSRVEGFGLVVAEAMCCGAIAIRTPSGGCKDQIVEGKTGFVVPFNNSGAIAEAIEKVADTLNKSTCREHVMEFASKRFAKEKMIGGTSDLYRSVASKRRLDD